MELGTRIALWRKAKGLTQRTLAKKIGVTASAISYWETPDTSESHTSPSQAHLHALVEALGLTMTAFYGPLPKSRRSRLAA